MQKVSTQKGFSLVEVLVSTALFTTVAIISLGALLSLLDASDKTKNLNNALDSLNFALESMSREIRVGTSYNCAGTGDCLGGGTTFSFVSSEGDAYTYQYNAGAEQIERIFNGGAAARMTGSNIRITDMKFYAVGTVPGDDEQPRVTITIKAEAGGKNNTQVAFDLQSTVTQRYPDI